MKSKEWLSMFNGLCLFKKMKNDPIMLALQALLEALKRQEETEGVMGFYNEYAYQLLEKDAYFSSSHYLADQILYGNNLFVEKLEKEGKAGVQGLVSTFLLELGLLYELSQISSQQVKLLMTQRTQDKKIQEMIKSLVEWDVKKTPFPFKEGNFKESLEEILHFYEQNGSGEFARYDAFTWNRERGLEGVKNPDSIRLEDLVSYESQKQEVVDNTLKFLQGYEGNNLLLYGARGTGKSSLVKAVVNAYHGEGLKLIEVSKENLINFDKLTLLLRDRKQKFIVFVDDLAFEDSEQTYTALKTILEGGVCTKPSNVLIYATSNRRHLVKEKLSDRTGLLKGGSEEVHAKDVIEEKLSLADRFGKTISFSTPNQNQYLEIVTQIAKSKKIALDEETLKRKAIQWEMLHNGRSGRSAKQFIVDLEGSSFSFKEKEE